MKVLHAPVNVGNQPWTLSRAERELGVAADVVVNYSTWLGYPADRVLGMPGQGSLLRRLRRMVAGLGAPFRYDVLHYYFGRSLLTWDDLGTDAGLPYLDLRLAKHLGKTVVLTLQGCDARLAGESNRRNAVTMCRPQGCSLYSACLAATDARRRRLIDEIVPLADRTFFLNPELGHYVPGATFMPYANVAVEENEPALSATRERPILLHAPSDDSIKGSALIEAALEELARYYHFDYVAVRNKPHQEAMALYREADLVIDQVLAGWYGGFAVELMSLGKPVACYLRNEDLGFLPLGMRRELPVLPVDPRRLAEDFAALLDRRAEWRDIGAAGRRFVLRWHNPRRIARALVAIYRDPAATFEIES